MIENKIHVAYGFHVNCYHSYRGDTNDSFGFGSDIRIINKILDILTDFNERGIPVKGTWDSENFFSLQKILPQYAPEIMEKMKMRVKKYGDENIIMGYNNGALSAMTEDEFAASIELSVTNADGSGLVDIFGECEKIVRPQEVMFTPSQVSLYNKLGVKALCLYYSCVPFDAFRTIVPPLSDEYAFNPLKYTYKNESMTIIPTYSNSDVCDAGTLRAWVKELRKKQEKGLINHDLLIFINMDADSMFWESMDLGPLTGKIANTDGIKGLVEEIADLPYVVYDTVGGYLKNHEALYEIDFTHDTADGNFTGYASWSEKPFNRKIWTSLERARAMAKLTAKKDSESPSFSDRVILLSTTHFGLATPVLNIQREKTALTLAQKVVDEEKAALPKSDGFTIYNTNGTTLQCLQLTLKKKLTDVSCLNIKSKDLESFTAVSMNKEGNSVYVMLSFKKIKKKYDIEISYDAIKEKPHYNGILSSGDLSFSFSPKGKIVWVQYKDKKLGTDEFLQSFITYGGKKYSFDNIAASYLPVGGTGEGVRLTGAIHLPGEEEAGSFTYDFFTSMAKDAVFVASEVNYPYTPELISISTENSSLGRYTDMKWHEAVPFQLTPNLKGDIRVIKRNFMDDVSSFRTQSFPECDNKNQYVASFNHQLSAGLVGLSDENAGLIVANARQVLGSMAHCPMRLEKDKTVRMNPFGTYYGNQRHHFGRAHDEILGTYTLVAAQGKPLAPSYNGSSETALLGLYAFDGGTPNESKLKEICAFADGCVAVSGDSSIASPFDGDNVKSKKSKADNKSEKDLKSPVMTGIYGNLKNYITKGAVAIGHIIFTQLKTK